MPCVVADTSPLFYLAYLDRLDLLNKLYGEVHVPDEVWTEARLGGRRYPTTTPRLEAARVTGWLSVHDHLEQVGNQPALVELDEGERQAFLLALSLSAGLVLIDEKRGRRAALLLGLTSTGTAGILIEAKRQGLVSLVAPMLRRLRGETTFWLHPDDEIRALALVDERPDGHPDFFP